MDGDGGRGAGFTAFVRDQSVLVVSAVLALLSVVAVPPSESYLGYIDVRTLCILFCFMAVVALMRECNAFSVLAQRMLRGSRGLRTTCTLLVALPFLCSMLITNDVALIAFVPFTAIVLSTAGRMGCMIPVVVLQTVAANLGSMLLPFGNPQNLFLCSEYGLGIPDFLVTVGPMVLVGGVALVVLCRMFGTEAVSVDFVDAQGVSHVPHLAVAIALFAVCAMVVVRAVPYQAALIVTVAAVALIMPRALTRVDYGLILTFVFLFIFVGNVSQIQSVNGLLSGLMEWSPVITSVGTSQVISNVPAAIMLSGFTDDWQGLLSGVNIGGFGTPIASMASLISLRLYTRTEGADVGRYLVWFTAVNVLMLILLLGTNAMMSLV